MEKTCFKCLRVLPLAEFYTHPQMADGHVNKCRDCNKKDVQRNYRRRKEYYRAYDAVRNRSKERTAKRAEYAKKNPEKIRAHKIVCAAIEKGVLKRPGKCSVCMRRTSRAQAHHTDYSRPLDVIWLCASCHQKEHS